MAMIKKETDDLKYFRVPCMNKDDGCKNTSYYYAHPSQKPLKKLCEDCATMGAPSTRTIDILRCGGYGTEGEFFTAPIQNWLQITAMPKMG